MTEYKPEGLLLDTPENQAFLKNYDTLATAMACGAVLEARAAVCDYSHNLIVDLGFCRGVIPYPEGAVGIAEGTTRDIAIISRVGKPVSFVVTGFELSADGVQVPLLSRRAVQQRCAEQYISHLRPGDIIPARVTHLEPFGCFVDIGCGVSSLIPIDSISVSRISHPRDRFRTGFDILAVVKCVDSSGRITLSHKELLGTWGENAARFRPGETVAGIIRSVESYGVFVELSPNLAGLAEPREGAAPGQHASVYIKSLLPDKMKIKLIIIDTFYDDTPPEIPEYFTSSGTISRWVYSPPGCQRVMQSVFTETSLV